MATRKNEAIWIDSRQRWQINVQSDGERRTFSSSIAGKKGKIAAEKKADAWLENQIVDESKKTCVILDRWIGVLQNTTSQSHWRQYQLYIKKWIVPVIGMKRIGKLSERDLQDVIDNAYRHGNNGKGMSAKSLRNIRACLSSFIKYCRSVKCTTLFPENIKIPSGARPSVKTIATQEDLRKLFSISTSAFRGEQIDDPFVYAYRFMVATGLRPGELIGLERSDIRDGKMYISHSINDYGEHTRGKNQNARRTQKLSNIALQILNDQRAFLMRKGIVSKYVFPEMTGSCASQQSFRRFWQRYRQANGIEGASTPYEMRHTFVSIVDEMPDLLKKMVVGHSKNMDTIGVYGHQKAGDLDRAAAYVDAAFFDILNDKK